MLTQNQKDLIKKIKADKKFMAYIEKQVKDGRTFLKLAKYFDELAKETLAPFVEALSEDSIKLPTHAQIKARMLAVSARTIEARPELFKEFLEGEK